MCPLKRPGHPHSLMRVVLHSTRLGKMLDPLPQLIAKVPPRGGWAGRQAIIRYKNIRKMNMSAILAAGCHAHGPLRGANASAHSAPPFRGLQYARTTAHFHHARTHARDVHTCGFPVKVCSTKCPAALSDDLIFTPNARE